MSEVRVALVGYGLAGAVFHAPLIEANPDLSLDSIVTSNPERVALARQRHPKARLLSDIDMLWDAAGGHDLVVVATPNSSHVPVGLAAIHAGLHVVVDKPFAPTSADGKVLAAAAVERRVMLTVFQNRRLDGDFLTLRRLIEAGDLGPVTRFESRFERWRPQVQAGAWRERGAPEEAGGVLFDLGSHLVDQAVQLFGPPTHVYGEVAKRRPGAEVDDDAFVALEHQGGVRSHLWMSLVARLHGPRFRVLGLEGAFEKHGLDPQEDQLGAGIHPGDPAFGVEPMEQWGILARDEQAPRSVQTERGDYPRFYQEVVTAIRDGSAPPVVPADAIATLEILETARVPRP